jgi:hypothetical protein
MAQTEGPDAIDIKRIKGEVFSRQQMVQEAGEIFETTGKEIVGLDAIFMAAEALIPSSVPYIQPRRLSL